MMGGEIAVFGAIVLMVIAGGVRYWTPFLEKVFSTVASVNRFVDQAFNEYAKIKKEQFEALAEAHKRGDDDEVKRIVDTI